MPVRFIDIVTSRGSHLQLVVLERVPGGPTQLNDGVVNQIDISAFQGLKPQTIARLKMIALLQLLKNSRSASS